MLRAVAPALSCALVALAVAGCGEAGSGGDADPATLVPASAPLYFEATIRPEGELRENALAAAEKLLRTPDPAAKLRELVDEALDDDDLTWERDFAPWVGERAGAWGRGADGASETFAAVIAVSDEEAAKAALPRLQGGDGKRGTYEGVDYLTDSEGNAAGLVDGFMVVGKLEAFKQTVDARNADTLSDVERYGDVVDDLDDDRLGHYYVDTKVVIDAAMAADPEAAAQLDQVRGFLPFDKLGPLAGSFSANGDLLALDQTMADVPDGPLRQLAAVFAGGETELLPSLPGDAWGALAVPDIGEGAQTLFGSVAGILGAAAIGEQIRDETGLDLQADVFALLGDVGVFVRGTTEADLDGAIVLESTDDERAATTFGKLVGLIAKEAGVAPEPLQLEGADSAVAITMPGAAQTLVLARGEGRMVAAYGERAAAAALDPDATLADTPGFGAAEDALGDLAPSMVLSVPAIIALVDAMGEADPGFDEARPYLEALETITGGGKLDGDTIRSRTAVTLKWLRDAARPGGARLTATRS